jgi:hypothetical protein
MKFCNVSLEEAGKQTGGKLREAALLHEVEIKHI